MPLHVSAPCSLLVYCLCVSDLRVYVCISIVYPEDIKNRIVNRITCLIQLVLDKMHTNSSWYVQNSVHEPLAKSIGGLLTLSTRYNYLTDTTGLQSSTAVMELNGSITVTCIFAPGASSPGCQVTIFTMDNMYIFSRNITRPNEDSPVSYQQCLQQIKAPLQQPDYYTYMSLKTTLIITLMLLHVPEVLKFAV